MARPPLMPVEFQVPAPPFGSVDVGVAGVVDRHAQGYGWARQPFSEVAPAMFATVQVGPPPAGSAEVITLPSGVDRDAQVGDGQSIALIAFAGSTLSAPDHVSGPAASAAAANAGTMQQRQGGDRSDRSSDPMGAPLWGIFAAASPGQRSTGSAGTSRSARRSSSARTSRTRIRGCSSQGAGSGRNRINPQESVPRGRNTMRRPLLRR